MALSILVGKEACRNNKIPAAVKVNVRVDGRYDGESWVLTAAPMYAS